VSHYAIHDGLLHFHGHCLLPRQCRQGRHEW
jgi:hypothetical protein